ncbi:unnamed protein product [Arctia plantaginis]|uniref:Programmed cell death protein 7 n=1 Tax=Arctia plantaginis TaxID=874455 RepID=A0A8S1AEQ6_ARCPL|nr:unnamed protein product [Arctia plantaginis]CAB3254000.1 unnamed protein product [Arctia plantaginis]
MSYNPNFYNKFRRNNATFHHNFRPHFVPPPPAPPPFFIPPTLSSENIPTDQEFLKGFEPHISVGKSPVHNKKISISEVREKLHTIILSLNNLKAKDKMLTENISKLSDEEWSSHFKQIEEKKAFIDSTLTQIKGPSLDVLQKLLAKRVAKRLRLKRVRSEIKKEKEDKWKEQKERSRKIDENLQRIKDDIIRAQQEQEAKLEADVVLKEVMRKKNDAKKCIMKLDLLVKLRKARQNTAKGRGETVPESETVAFHAGIETLKVEWTYKLSAYEAEEIELRAKLKEDSGQQDMLTNATEKEVANNLVKWRETLFGGQLPQVDLRGDVTRFIAVRSQWDQYVSSEGTALPIGWVPPAKKVDS